MHPKHNIHFYAYYQNDVVVPSDLRKYGAAREEIKILPKTNWQSNILWICLKCILPWGGKKEKEKSNK